MNFVAAAVHTADAPMLVLKSLKFAADANFTRISSSCSRHADSAKGLLPQVIRHVCPSPSSSKEGVEYYLIQGKFRGDSNENALCGGVALILRAFILKVWGLKRIHINTVYCNL